MAYILRFTERNNEWCVLQSLDLYLISLKNKCEGNAQFLSIKEEALIDPDIFN